MNNQTMGLLIKDVNVAEIEVGQKGPDSCKKVNQHTWSGARIAGWRVAPQLPLMND